MTTRLDVRLDGNPSAATQARHSLDQLDGDLHPEILDDLRLLVTELVTNSVRHAHVEPCWVRVKVATDDELIHTEVIDPGHGFRPQDREAPLTAQGGWGLYLVDNVAERWGVDCDGVTKVWFDLSDKT